VTWKSEIKFYSSNTDLINKVNDVVIKMTQTGIDRKYITILCATKEQLTGILQSAPNKYAEGAFEIEGRVNVTTIHAYKGLENRFILICGPDDYDPNNRKQMSLIYIANTKATAQSIFF
jgi:superfamily I DNA/RNA helicase